MATFDDLRRFALTLPGAYEDSRSRGPGVSCQSSEIRPLLADGGRTIMKLEPSHQTFLFEVRPDVFEPCKVGTVNWSFVDLHALDAEELQTLVLEAWSTVVPKRISRPLVRDHGAKV